MFVLCEELAVGHTWKLAVRGRDIDSVREEIGVAFAETALIVENDPLLVRGWVRILRRSKISAEIVESLAAALEFLKTSAVPSFVFLDLELPDGDGSVLLSALTSLTPRPAIAVVSDHLDASRVVAFQSLGVLAIPKPLPSAALGELLELLRTAAAELEHPVDHFARGHKLSPRETCLLHLAIQGMNNDEAASALNCARATVSTYWNRIFIKTRLRSQRDVVAGILRAMVRSSSGQTRQLTQRESRNAGGLWAG